MIPKKLIIISLCLLLISCGGGTSESETTSDATGSNIVLTSDIEVEILFNEIFLSNAVTGDELKVGEGDLLQVNADGAPLVVTEVQHRDCNYWGQACRYVYRYRIEVPEGAYATYQQVNIEFVRTTGVSALNTVIQIPPLPTYTAPLQNSTFSLANDDIPISVYHASYYSNYTLSIVALLDTGVACVYRNYILDSGQSDFVIFAGTLVDNVGCLGDVVETKVRVNTRGAVVADPAFFSVFVYDPYSDNGVDITLIP